MSATASTTCNVSTATTTTTNATAPNVISNPSTAATSTVTGGMPTTSTASGVTNLTVSTGVNPASTVTTTTQSKVTENIVFTQEETNFLRLTSLVLKIAPRAVRQMFDIYNHPNNFVNTLKTNQGQLQKLRDKRVISEEQWKTLYPKHGTVASKDFDLTLMILLLREVSGLIAPSSGWNKLPSVKDQSDGADLARIKYHRNMIAHATTCSIINYVFSNAWQDLSQAVIRIGGQGFTAEVTSMLTSSLDQSYKELYRELKILKVDHIIPPNIQYLQNVKLEVWKEENKTFVSTRATKEVKVSVEQNNFTIVSGPPGSGKSATVHHIALQLKDEGYRVCYVSSAEKIIDYWIPEVKQLFILDDPFGVHDVDTGKLNQWKDNNDDLNICFQYSCMKVVATVRTHIIQDEKISQTISLFQYANVCLTDENISLSNEERLEMFRIHASFQNRNELLDIGDRIQNYTISCFPLLCRIYAADKESKHSVEDFFKKPLYVIGEEIKQLQTNDPLRYFCLLFCMIHDNKLDSGVLSLEDECEKTKTLRETFLELCRLPTSLSRFEIKAKLDTLLNTYLKREDSTYNFIHDVIHDAVIRHVGQLPSNIIKLILLYCSSEFLKERVRLSFVDCEETDSYIVLQQDLEIFWGDRLLKDIKDGHWNDVFNNKCLCTEEGDFIVARALETKKIADIENIMCYSTRDQIPTDMSIEIFSQGIKSKLNDDCCSAFHWVVFRGLASVAKTVLSILSESARRTLNSYISLLLLSCETGKEDMVKVIMFVGCGINYLDMEKLSSLNVASGKGYDKLVKILIENGTDVNKCTIDGNSPLCISSFYGHDNVVKILTESEADVNKCDNYGWSPLSLASCNGHDKIVKLLIDSGVDVNKCSNTDRIPPYAAVRDQVLKILMITDISSKFRNDWMSPIYVSSLFGHEKIVKMLIDSGAKVTAPSLYVSSYCGYHKILKMLLDSGTDINTSNSSGKSPLYASSQNGHEKVVKMLLDSGADVNKSDNEGLSPLYVALHSGYDKVVRLLVDGGADPVNVNDCHRGESLLHISSRTGRDKIVKMLIKSGADINKCNCYDESPLFVSSSYGHDKVVKMLIDNGADVNICDNELKSPLFLASYYGYEKVVKMLIDNGAELNKSKKSGESSLYVASSCGRDKVVKMLIENGADVDKCSNDCSSPLYASSRNGHDKVVKMLLESGAGVNTCNNNGDSSLYVSSCSGHDKVVKLLTDNGADVNKCNYDDYSPLYVSSDNGHDKVVKMLINSGSDVNRCNKYGNSPLFASSRNGHDTAVKILIEKGADANKCNDFGMSPVYISSGNGHYKIVKMLVDSGADVNTCTNDNYSPLYVSSHYGHDKIVKLLIDIGADVNKCGNDGKSPLRVASDENHNNLVQILKNSGGM